jgi:hypothetical protein
LNLEAQVLQLGLKATAVFTAQLGFEHGLIGLMQNLVGADFSALRIESNADTNGNLQKLITRLYGFSYGG